MTRRTAFWPSSATGSRNAIRSSQASRLPLGTAPSSRCATVRIRVPTAMPFASPNRRTRNAPPQPPLVADAQGDAVCVEPFQQQLRNPPRRAEQIAESPERDRAGALALLDE